jgi:hypothetical protein
MHQKSRTSLSGASLLAAASDASASTGATVEGVLLTVLTVGGVVWLAFAFIGPFRRSMLRIPRNANRPLLLLLGAVALSYAAGSAALGRTWLGAGVVLHSVEPVWFWNLVKLQAGAGVALLALGLLTPRGPK